MSFAQLRRCRPSLLTLEDRLTPSGLPSAWTQRGSGGGGALFAPQISPFNANDIYIASDMSEMFHTTDGGASWQTLDFRQIQGNHEARVQFTNDPNIRYSLDYSNVDGLDLVRPSKSTDGGQTWDALASDPTDGGAFYMYADPGNHNRVLVTDYTNLYFSVNGGSTWSLEYTGDSNAGLLVGGAFWDGANIYLGTNSGLLVSNNGGQSFAVASVGGLPAGQVILSFAGAKQGTTTRFLAVTLDAGDVYASIPGYDNGGGGKVVTLDVGAANWTERNLGSTSAWPFFAGMALADINTMYVAGGSSVGSPTVYKSTNGGQSWTSVLQTAGNQNVATGWSGAGGDRDWSYGEMALGFAVAANDASKIVITDFGFGHSSTDGGASWKALYVAPADRNPAGANTPKGRTYHDTGLDNTTAWGVTWADATHVFVSNSDIRGQLSLDGGQTFGFGYTGHSRNSMYRVVAHANGNLYGAAASVHDLYQSTYLQDSRIDGGNGAVLFSINKGVTWQTLRDFGRVVSWVAADPTNANRLYASVVNANGSGSAGGIYVTNNLNAGTAATWTKLANPPRTEGHPFNIVVLSDGTLVVSYSGRRNPAGTFTASSGVFVSTDSGQTWADRSDAGMRYWTKDVVVDPFDATQNTWYAGVFSGWGGAPNDLGGLYKTTNRGATWTRITSGLDRVTSVTVNPTNQNEAFVTTETQGLWFSTNFRSATPTFTEVANYPFRQPERVFFNPHNLNEVWVTSFGGGVRVGTAASAAPLSIASVQVGDGTSQRSSVRSLTVTFSGVATLGTGAVDLTLLGASGGSVSLNVTSQVVGGRTVATLAFLSHTDAGSNGSLRDGDYRLTVRATAVTDGSGQQLDGNGDGAPGGDNVTSFHRLFGDANADRVVNSADLSLFRTAFGSSTGTLGLQAGFDFDGDGFVNSADLNAFRLHFGAALLP